MAKGSILSDGSGAGMVSKIAVGSWNGGMTGVSISNIYLSVLKCVCVFKESICVFEESFTRQKERRDKLEGPTDIFTCLINFHWYALHNLILL